MLFVESATADFGNEAATWCIDRFMRSFSCDWVVLLFLQPDFTLQQACPSIHELPHLLDCYVIPRITVILAKKKFATSRLFSPEAIQQAFTEWVFNRTDLDIAFAKEKTFDQ